MSTRIECSITGDDALLDAARAHRDYVAGETLAVELHLGLPLAAPDRDEPVVLDEHVGALAVRRLGDGRSPLPGSAPVEQS